jgi:hypothetical protein
MNIAKKLLMTSLAGLTLAALAGCGSTATSTSKKELPEVSEFSFDFSKSAYSFKGAKNATIYFVKLYSETKASDGTYTLNANAVATSEMIKATTDNETNTYTGSLSYTAVAGDYRAVVKAFATGGYKGSATSIDGTSYSLGAPTVTATFGTQGPDTIISLSITAGDTMTKTYTVNVYGSSDGTGTPVYTNATAAAGAITLTASDLSVAKLADTDVYSVSVQGNAYDSYTAASAVIVAVSKANNGGQGGGGGGGGGDFTIAPESVTFAKGAPSFTMPLGTHTLLQTCKATLASAATAGSDYTYAVKSTDTGAPFTVEGTLEIVTGGKVTLAVKAAGPIAASNVTGTWALAADQITITWAK